MFHFSYPPSSPSFSILYPLLILSTLATASPSFDTCMCALKMVCFIPRHPFMGTSTVIFCLISHPCLPRCLVYFTPLGWNQSMLFLLDLDLLPFVPSTSFPVPNAIPSLCHLLSTIIVLSFFSFTLYRFQSIRRFTQTTRQPRNNILYTLKPNQTACAASSSSPTSPPSSTTPCSTASSSPIPTTPPPPLPPLISDAQYASMLAESSEASDPQQGGRSRQVGPIMKKMLIVGRRTNVDMRDFLDRGKRWQ